MADILIRGMEMPKDQHTITITICYDGYAVVEFRDRDCYPKAIEAYEAVPLPEGHGRLIDADVMVEGLMKCAKNPPDNDQESRWFYLFTTEIVKSCETIVPAEGGTDND